MSGSADALETASQLPTVVGTLSRMRWRDEDHPCLAPTTPSPGGEVGLARKLFRRRSVGLRMIR